MNYEYSCDKSTISLVNTHLCHPLSSVDGRQRTTSYDVVRCVNGPLKDAGLLYPLLHDSTNFVVNRVQAGVVYRPDIKSEEVGVQQASRARWSMVCY